MIREVEGIVDEGGVLRLEVFGLTRGRRVRAVLLDVEEPTETQEPSSDVEDFA